MSRVAGIVIVVAASVMLGATVLQAAGPTWTRIEHPALRGGGSTMYISDILPPEGQASPWLAVGYLVDSDGTRTPSAWTSPDGVAWRRTTMGPTSASERRDGPFFVARRGSVAVALGDRFEGELRTAAWFSSESGSWTALTSASDPLVSYRGRITAVDAGPSAFTAVGVEYFTSFSRVTVFVSSDGRGWTTLSTLEPPEGLRPNGVSAASGRIVIVGDTAYGQRTQARIWMLEDDGSWTRIEPSALVRAADAESVATSIAWNSAYAYVAGGSVTRGANEIPVLWTSSDARTWSRLGDGTPPEDSANAAVQHLDVVGSGYLASGASDTGPRLWRSSDGRSWSAVPPPFADSERKLVVAASDGSTIVLVSRTETGTRLYRRTGTSWARADTGSAFPRSKAASELVDVAALKTRVVAAGAGSDGRALVMVSSAGGSWRRASFPDRAGRLLAITADRGSFTAVGWRLVRGRARLATWTSRDGTRWKTVRGTALVPVGAFVDVTPTRRGLVAISLQPSSRGFVTAVWRITSTHWQLEDVLGRGDPRAICAGPHGVTAVATLGGGTQSRVVSWTRASSGRWPSESELVASSGASAARCADAPAGTAIVGQDGSLGASVWLRARPGDAWRKTVFAQTSPPSSVGDIVREGSGFLATGAFGGRGQVDLAVWLSPDGRGWGWLGSTDPVFSEAGYQQGQGVARVGQRIVVAGRHGAGDAGLWVGPLPRVGGDVPP